jgi:hypothetical protein
MQYALKVRQKQRDARWGAAQVTLILLGNVVISWAGIERMLDELIAWYQHHGTNLETEHPRALSRKLAYLKTMERDGRFNEEIRAFLRRTRIETNRLGDERHELIHGLVHRLNRTGNIWQSQRIVTDGAYARIVHRIYNDGDLNLVQAEISALAHDMSPKIWAIIGGDPRYIASSKLEQARGELGMV